MMAIVVLPEGTYYRLRYLQASAEATAAAAKLAADEAFRTYRAAMVAAGRQHAFDPDVAYTWRDDACAIVPTPEHGPESATPPPQPPR